jgi:hypothetical protein
VKHKLIVETAFDLPLPLERESIVTVALESPPHRGISTQGTSEGMESHLSAATPRKAPARRKYTTVRARTDIFVAIAAPGSGREGYGRWGELVVGKIQHAASVNLLNPRQCRVV